MAANKKLTPLLAGRTITSVTQGDNVLRVDFADGSIMSIKIATPGPSNLGQDRTVKKVRQKYDVMNLDFSDDSTWEIKLAEPTSCVMLRDGSGNLEYAD